MNGRQAQPTEPSPLLQVQDLRTHFFTEDGVVEAVNGVDLEIRRGEVFGLVGESGCGKSVTGLSILRLVDKPGKIVGGDILFNGRSLLELSEREMVRLRGDCISMIFQQPLSSINPVFSVGYQITETLRSHQHISRQDAREQ
ncbi:MAG TPA: ATP-binding cassette domain-containing protein, partial [Anaerolineae bacterium]|nr:ATP-binding cassette domain-containing protein [Anaerolineae bacterium]